MWNNSDSLFVIRMRVNICIRVCFQKWSYDIYHSVWGFMPNPTRTSCNVPPFHRHYHDRYHHWEGIKMMMMDLVGSRRQRGAVGISPGSSRKWLSYSPSTTANDDDDPRMFLPGRPFGWEDRSVDSWWSSSHRRRRRRLGQSSNRARDDPTDSSWCADTCAM